MQHVRRQLIATDLKVKLTYIASNVGHQNKHDNNFVVVVVHGEPGILGLPTWGGGMKLYCGRVNGETSCTSSITVLQ